MEDEKYIANQSLPSGNHNNKPQDGFSMECLVMQRYLELMNLYYPSHEIHKTPLILYLSKTGVETQTKSNGGEKCSTF